MKIKDIKVVYGVRWVQATKSGTKSEGYRLWTNKDRCIAEAKQAAELGKNEIGYWGPAKPIKCLEMVYECLSESIKREIRDFGGKTHTPSMWTPVLTNDDFLIGE